LVDGPRFAQNPTHQGTALVGTLIGQLVFGLLGDKLGRKAPYGW
jgi:MFS family permease